MDQTARPAPLETAAEVATALEHYSPERPQVAKVRYTHDAMIDLIITHPGISQAAIAKNFGYTQAWVSTIFASDAFQTRLALRREELVDPTIVMTMEERFKALTTRSLEILQEKLAQPAMQVPDALALKAIELGAKSLGLGGNAPAPTAGQATDRLDRLAERLTGLIHNQRGSVQDVEIREVPCTGQGDREGLGQAASPDRPVQGSESGGNQST